MSICRNFIKIVNAQFLNGINKTLKQGITYDLLLTRKSISNCRADMFFAQKFKTAAQASKHSGQMSYIRKNMATDSIMVSLNNLYIHGRICICMCFFPKMASSLFIFPCCEGSIEHINLTIRHRIAPLDLMPGKCVLSSGAFCNNLP